LSIVLLMAGVIAVVLALNALRPIYAPATLAVASFFAGWLTTELALHGIFAEVVLVSLLVWAGAMGSIVGQVGVGLHVTALLLLVAACWRSLASGGVVTTALADLFAHEPPETTDWRQLLFPLPVRHRQVERVRDLVYYDGPDGRLKLDLFRRRGDTSSTSNARSPGCARTPPSTAPIPTSSSPAAARPARTWPAWRR
jgi:hypothetical protein